MAPGLHTTATAAILVSHTTTTTTLETLVRHTAHQ